MITQEEQKQIIEEYTRVQNVCMMALNNLLGDEDYKRVLNGNNIKDIETNFELFIYDLKNIDTLMSDNMDLLWEIKDKEDEA